MTTICAILFKSLYPQFISVDIHKIEEFLVKNKRNHLLYFIYATANKLDTAAEESFFKLIMKYKSPERQALYKTIYALYKKDTPEANANVHFINQPNYKRYYQALIAIEEGDLNSANTISNQINSTLLKDITKAEIHIVENNLELAKEYATKALLKSRGIQRYSVYKNFETLLKDTKIS